MLICQALPLATPVFADEISPETPAGTETEAGIEAEVDGNPSPQITDRPSAIKTHCDAIKTDLKKVQKDDSHARVYLGGRFETINSKFVIPLNTRLVENTLSTPELIDNQNDLTKSKATFVSDFVEYQKELENLVNFDCKSDPDKFYENLGKVREKRKTVRADVSKIRNLLSEHTKTITSLKETL